MDQKADPEYPVASPESRVPSSADDPSALIKLPFVRAALEPDLIPGVYLYCDQWCMYCPVTARCLAYRCLPTSAAEENVEDIYKNLAERMYESLKFVKRLTAAEGRTIPELDALLANDPRNPPAIPEVNDPLERMARRYAIVSSSYLMSRPDFPFTMKLHSSGPTAFEVFAWFHALIAAKVYRAIVGSATAARGDAARASDARASAKTALIGIDRSIAALRTMSDDDDDARLEDMLAQLRRLERELRARFPEAPTFVRPGLDEPPGGVKP